jgi:hypothetical protein
MIRPANLVITISSPFIVFTLASCIGKPGFLLTVSLIVLRSPELRSFSRTNQKDSREHRPGGAGRQRTPIRMSSAKSMGKDLPVFLNRL